jgi:hypothetical protein
MTRIDAAQGEESQENGLPTDGGAPDGRAARPVQAARAADDGAQARASRRVPR